MKKISILFIFNAFIYNNAAAQFPDSIRSKIQQVIVAKRAVTGVAITANNSTDTFSFNAEHHYPMQSVFKLHIALVVLSQIDKGKLALNQKVLIGKKDLLPGLYSPIRDKYPNGVTLTIAEILGYTVSSSDNVGCDILLKLLGGPGAVEKYFKENGFDNISIKYNEEQQQHDWNLQFENWTTPKAANKVLAAFWYNRKKLLSAKSHQFIWKLMTATETGAMRLKGQLSANTIVAHKTGSSGTNAAGITAAVNDIGVVILPNGEPLFISVFVSDSKEDAKTNEQIIADIAKLVWDYYRFAS